MSDDLEYLLLREKGPYHEVLIRTGRRLNTNPGLCRFYTIVFTVVSASLLVLLLSLVYVFVLVPSWGQDVLTWDGTRQQGHITPVAHVLTHTQCGPVEGVIDRHGNDPHVYIFKGIPYALPPVGARRWAEPKKLEGDTCWRGMYSAKRFQNACLQPQYNSSSLAGSEDCLYLNVWTKSLRPHDDLPVIFWVHGGFLRVGSGNAPPFCPSAELTRATQAVYVSLNYRLGPMGFLALDVLGKGSRTGASGNYGLMDVILALTWVRDNIRNFGGNPNLVTVVGQRAGGTALRALLSSPLTSGLLHRAWLVSPSLIANTTAQQASRQDESLKGLTGCHDAPCLRNLSAEELWKHIPWAAFPVSSQDQPAERLQGHCGTDYCVLVDGHVLKEPPLQAWKRGRVNDVPILFTTTTENRELRLLPSPTLQSHHPSTSPLPATWEQFTNLVEKALGQFSQGVASEALLLYPATAAVSPRVQLSRMTSDECVTCQVQAMVNAASITFRSPVFYGVVTAFPGSPTLKFLNASVDKPGRPDPDAGWRGAERNPRRWARCG